MCRNLVCHLLDVIYEDTKVPFRSSFTTQRPLGSISPTDFLFIIGSPSFPPPLLFVVRKNMFKVNNKDTRTTLMASFWCLYCQPWIYFTLVPLCLLLTLSKQMPAGEVLQPKAKASSIVLRFWDLDNIYDRAFC